MMHGPLKMEMNSCVSHEKATTALLFATYIYIVRVPRVGAHTESIGEILGDWHLSGSLL